VKVAKLQRLLVAVYEVKDAMQNADKNMTMTKAGVETARRVLRAMD